MNPSQTSEWSGFYDLQDPSVSKRRQALDHLKGYYKTTSIVNLRMLGLPVLKGVVITRWDDRVRQNVLTFANARGFSRLLIRTDKTAETGQYMRGGYIIDLSELDKEVNMILGAGRIVILLEPRSPYEDLYSLNALFTPQDENILLEVVGPGFDMSDLKRGDISAHEVIYVPRQRPIARKVLGAKDVARTVVHPRVYRLSVRDRLAKIGHMVTSRGGKEYFAPFRNEDFEAVGRQYLESVGQTLLLQNEARYRPIPLSLLRTVYSYIEGLPERAKQLGIEIEPMVVSMTFFWPDYALAFWDIVWPRLKYVL